jgi:hypothetical protein
MSTKLPAPRLRLAMLSIGLAVFLLTLAWMLTFPVSFSV